MQNQLPEQYEPAPGPEGLGLEKALEGYFRGLQGPDEVSKKSSLDESNYDPWEWQLCNEP